MTSASADKLDRRAIDAFVRSMHEKEEVVTIEDMADTLMDQIDNDKWFKDNCANARVSEALHILSRLLAEKHRKRAENGDANESKEAELMFYPVCAHNQKAFSRNSFVMMDYCNAVSPSKAFSNLLEMCSRSSSHDNHAHDNEVKKHRIRIPEHKHTLMTKEEMNDAAMMYSKYESIRALWKENFHHADI